MIKNFKIIVDKYEGLVYSSIGFIFNIYLI